MFLPTIDLPKINTGIFDFGGDAKKKAIPPSFQNFVTSTFPDYDLSWHNIFLCGKLDLFAKGVIKRLMVFMPPRHGKSELVSRRLPAYILGLNPNSRIIATSYGADLARRMNRDVQRIIDHPTYERIFPHTQLFGKNIRTVAQGTYLRNSDMFEVVNHKGYYRSAGVGGAITGMGMDYGIIDDPFKNRKEAESLTVRNIVWDWYNSTFRTRLSPDGAILITVTRWHYDDPIGRLLEIAKNEPMADQWDVVVFPAIAEEPIADYDPREAGQALWPNRFSLEELAKARASMGSYEWASLYQQSPTPRSGGMFKREWFRVISHAPRDCKRVRYWDKAGTEGGGAFTVGVLIAMDKNGRFYIEDVVRGQWGAGTREEIIKQTAESDRAIHQQFAPITWIEQEPGSGGKESVENTIRNLRGFPVFADKVTGSKETRAIPLASQSEIGNVYLVAAPWNRLFLDEIESFPYGKYKDITDGASGGFNKLFDNKRKVAGAL